MSIIWTKEKCLESASKYHKRLDWHTNEQSAYQAARKKGWLDDCCKHMEVIIVPWTRERCIENARQYQTITEWIRAEKRAYTAACRYGWVDECRAHMPDKIIANKELCISTARKHTTITEWLISNGKTYHMAYKHKWLEECTAHMDKKTWKPKGYWTKERCVESASKFNRITHWIQSDGSKAYGAALRNGWIKECTAHMLKHVTVRVFKEIDLITLDMCLSTAKNYTRINNWRKAHRIEYRAAKYFGWLDECTAHMTKVVHWNKEKCLETAKQFNKIIDWQKSYGSAYVIARLNGWLDECTAHMIKQ